MEVATEGNQHTFHVQVYLDELERGAVQVELYAEPLNGGNPIREVMVRGESLIGSENAYTYSATVGADRAASHFTPRIIPYHTSAFVPLESPHILWYH